MNAFGIYRVDKNLLIYHHLILYIKSYLYSSAHQAMSPLLTIVTESTECVRPNYTQSDSGWEMLSLEQATV